MTEQEYDEQIAPALLEIAKKIEAMGGSIVARVEWGPDEAGTTTVMAEDASVAQHLTRFAALSHGNLDKLVMTALKRFDSSQTIVGSLMGGAGFQTVQGSR